MEFAPTTDHGLGISDQITRRFRTGVVTILRDARLSGRKPGDSHLENEAQFLELPGRGAISSCFMMMMWGWGDEKLPVAVIRYSVVIMPDKPQSGIT